MVRKRGKLAPKRHIFKTILTSGIKTRSLIHLFIFKESEKILTMDSVMNVLLDHFNECERISSLDDLFNFRESEKSLTMNFMGGSFFVNLVPQARKRVKIIPENTLLENRGS